MKIEFKKWLENSLNAPILRQRQYSPGTVRLPHQYTGDVSGRQARDNLIDKSKIVAGWAGAQTATLLDKAWQDTGGPTGGTFYLTNFGHRITNSMENPEELELTIKVDKNDVNKHFNSQQWLDVVYKTVLNDPRVKYAQQENLIDVNQYTAHKEYDTPQSVTYAVKISKTNPDQDILPILNKIGSAPAKQTP